jgi:hypothetical protein
MVGTNSSGAGRRKTAAHRWSDDEIGASVGRCNPAGQINDIDG